MAKARPANGAAAAIWGANWAAKPLYRFLASSMLLFQPCDIRNKSVTPE